MNPSTAKVNSETEGCMLALVSNIPAGFHSKDLRRFFCTFVEKGRFSCFHYRHRPVPSPDDPTSSNSKTTLARCCCLVRISGTKRDRSEFIRYYNGKNWTNENGGILPSSCHISPARLADGEPLPMELKPPASMPQGNVGTPTEYFLEAIKACRLPSSVIAKLGLIFPKRNGRRIYSTVPPPKANHGEEESYDDVEEGDQESDDAAEDWERHEAQYDDVTDQERTKERLYEEDMEVVWEKGGPGLVFYTDSYFWDQQETDTDAKWADDWDVDTNVYVDPNDADKDAKDSVAIRRENMLRSGQLTESVFKKRVQSPNRKRRAEFYQSDEEKTDDLGVNNSGRKMMERHGWKPGMGLGASSSGSANPVHDELQEVSRIGLDKRGFGYFGEKLDRKAKRIPQKPLITTIYDKPSETDPPESLLMRHELTWNKHR